MANKQIDMSKIRKVIKFHSDGKSKVFISSYLSLSRNTVKKYISLFKVLDIPFSEFNKKSDAELESIFVL
jgi:transposase